MKNSRRLLVRLVALLVVIGIAACMMVIGRGHTVYFDNKSLEWEGTTYETPYKVVVFVNGEQAAKLYDKERGMATWIGQDFKMDLEVTEVKKGEEVTTSYSLKLPYNMDGIVINLPAYMAGLPEEAYLSEFIPLTTEEDAEEVPEVDEFGMDAMVEGDQAQEG